MITIKDRTQKGIGLSELLITLLISSFIIMGLMNHYLATKKYYNRLQKKLANTIDLQLVAELLRDSIRKAGFTPCLNVDNLTTLDQRENVKPLKGLEFNVVDKPWLRLSRMDEHFSSVIEIINPTQLVLGSKHALHTDDAILIADCYHAEVQKIRYVHQQTIQLMKPLAFTYYSPIYVGAWLEETFAIRPNQAGKRALFYQLKHQEELTAVISNFALTVNKLKKSVLLSVVFHANNTDILKFDTRVRA